MFAKIRGIFEMNKVFNQKYYLCYYNVGFKCLCIS